MLNPITQQASESIIYHLNRWLIADKRVRTKKIFIIIYKKKELHF